MGDSSRRIGGGSPRAKAVAFRLAAVALGLAPLLLCEALLAVAGWGRATDYDDPFVGFSEIHPLFVKNEATGRFEIAPSRLEHFCPDSFPADKPADEFRIFVLGGSTVQGRPWGPETSFTSWLELSLQAADPNRRWDVVNCGGVSYASYRLAPILQEVLNYQPDLVIFCEGNNEFLEDRTYGELKTQQPAALQLARQAARLRTYNVARAALQPLLKKTAPAGDRPVLGPEVEARLDERGGMARFQRDPAWQQQVEEHFSFNLERMVDLARARNVPLLLVAPVANLEWPPFKPEPGNGLSDETRAEYQRLLATARECAGTVRAIAALERATRIDPQHALAHFELGLHYREQGRNAAARDALFLAKELDVCPLRITQPLRERLLAAARASGTPLVDAEELLSALSRSGYPDNQWLIDHCHPTIEGHEKIAERIVAQMAEQGLLKPVVDWQATYHQLRGEHLQALPFAYFERGRERLKSEQGWARGLVTREKKRVTTAIGASGIDRE